MKFFAVLDCQSLRHCPPSLQHLAIRSWVEQQGGEVSFYTCEDPLSLPYGVLKARLPTLEAEALCFFTVKQLIQTSFDFPFLEELLASPVGQAVGLARENVIITPETYPSLRPWLWREGLDTSSR